MRFKSFKLGVLKGKSEEDAEEEQIQEQAGNKTGGIKATAESPEGVLEVLSKAENDEESRPGPHGPLSELTVEPQDTLLDEEADVSGLLDESEEDVTIVEVTHKAAAPEEKEKAEEPPKEDSDDSFNNLFSTDEEEANPLENLINSLPDVTVRELLDDLQEIKDLLQDGQQK
jgi:hypothetical protein